MTTTARRYLALRRFDEKACQGFGVECLCGADEVGRGPLAGPVVAAAVCLPPGVRLPGLDDSKVLEPERRREVATRVRAMAIGVGWAFVGPRAIERMNIHRASLTAIGRSVRRLAARVPVAHVLVDGMHCVPDLPWPQQAVVDGDARSLAVAAASVVAKCVRDGFMQRLAREYPHYGFERHKGYSTPEHLEALLRHGPCPWHRFSFAPVAMQGLFDAVAMAEKAAAAGIDVVVPAPAALAVMAAVPEPAE